ncbi:MAG TPA: hypothetical protein VGB52_14615 [Actinomycetota bacterium]
MLLVRFAGALMLVYAPVGLSILIGIAQGWSRGAIALLVFGVIVIVTALAGYLLDRPPPGIGGVAGMSLLMFATFPIYLAWFWASRRANLSWRFKR